jgi:hypothetical protein
LEQEFGVLKIGIFKSYITINFIQSLIVHIYFYSGGITRNWIGVPRMLFDDLESKKYRCACIRLDEEFEENEITVKLYGGCTENATSCILKTIENIDT